MSAQLIVRSGLGLMLLLAATDVAAQARKDVSVGYSFIESNNEGAPEFPLGVTFSYAEGGVLKGVGDLSFYGTGGGDWLFMSQAGVRLGPQTRRARPFVQGLFGLTIYGAGSVFWTAQFGGGIDIPMRGEGTGPALRLGLDLPIFFIGNNPMNLRGTVGIVFSRLSQ